MTLGAGRLAAVIFDLDGTLRDTLGVRYELLKEVSQRTGVRVLSRDEVKEVMRSPGPPWDYMLPQGVDAEQKARFIREFARINAERYPEMYALGVAEIPGAVMAVEKIAGAGLKVGLVTASTANKETAPPWERRFYDLAQALVTRQQDPGLPPKPAPDTILACLDRMGVQPQQAVCVGDAPTDIQAGKAAGTFTVGVLTGISDRATLQQEAPDLILAGAGELPAALGLL